MNDQFTVTVDGKDYAVDRVVSFESDTIRKIEFITVLNGEPHKLLVEYTTTVADDLRRDHGIIIEEALMPVLLEEIQAEIKKTVRQP